MSQSHRLVQIILSILLCWNINCLQAVGQDCEYRYVTQPPTELRCNPYDTINQFTLTCSVNGPASPGVSFVWFRRTNNGNAEELHNTQLGVRIAIGSSSSDPRTVSTVSQITVSGLDETNDVGDYWCQVRLTSGTFFKEKSNILSLTNERQYTNFSRCTGSQSVNREDCLRMVNITIPVTTDLSFTTQSTVNINLHAIYASVGCTIILILLLSITIIVLLHKYKLKTNTQEDSNSRPDEQAIESLPVNSNQNEGFDYKENIAYDKVNPAILNENISYAPTDSHKFDPLYEEINDSKLSPWHGSLAYRQ